jgi:chromate transport protein ChrA
MPDFPGKPVGDYFIYFVAIPIVLVWIVATLLNRTKGSRLVGGWIRLFVTLVLEAVCRTAFWQRAVTKRKLKRTI